MTEEEYTMDVELHHMIQLAKLYMQEYDMLNNNNDTKLSEFDHYFQEDKKWDKIKNSLNKPITGDSNESLLKRILLFIPRLLIAIFRSVKSFFISQKDLKKEVKELHDRVNVLEKELNSSKTENSEIKDVLKKHVKVMRYVNDKVNHNKDLDEKTYQEIINAIDAINQGKANHRDVIKQMKAILIMSGYVMYTFDLKAYSNFLDSFENTLTKIEQFDFDTEEFINFGEFDSVNIANEIDSHKYRRNMIYSIDEFNTYTDTLEKRCKDVKDRCDKLTKKFEKLQKKYKNKTDVSQPVMTNINEVMKILSNISMKLNKMHFWYSQDTKNIRNAIDDEMRLINRL